MRALVTVLTLTLAAPLAARSADQLKQVAPAGSHATLDCASTRAGLADCRVIEEAPEQQGLGASALTEAPCLKLSDPKATSASIDEDKSPKRTRVKIQFDGAPLPIPPRWSGCGASVAEAMAPLVHVKYTAAPTGNDFASIYPPQAMAIGAQGDVLVQCAVRGDRLEDCSILLEMPDRLGFGQATLQIMKLFRVALVGTAEAPIEGGQVRMVVVWRQT